VDVCGCRENNFPHSLVAVLVDTCCHAVNMPNAKHRLENLLENLGLDDESDDETVCYFGSDGSDESVNLSSDELSSESDDESESDCEALADVRVWCAIDLQNPPIEPPCFPFGGQPGLQVSLTDCNDPLEYLRLFIDDKVIDVIVRETNQYAEQTLTRMPQGCLSHTRQWEPEHNTEATAALVLVSKPTSGDTNYSQNNE